MIFTLHEVKLWFKEEKIAPKSYNFLPNKVNVITGDATTGKTSFWRIIDYCLLSDKINVADPINGKVAWFGICFTINKTTIAIARKSPHRGAPSAELYFNEGELPSSLGSLIDNISIQELKSKLDVEFGISDKLRFPHGKESGRVQFNLSFRHFLLFNSITEDIIGNSNLYFDTPFYGKTDSDRALAHLFPMVIGVNNMENLKDGERLRKIDLEKKKLIKKEKDKEKFEIDYKADVTALISRLKDYALVDYDKEILSADEGLKVIKSAIEGIHKEATNTRLFSEIDDLQFQKTGIKSQINAIEKYQKEFEGYHKNMEKAADSLKPIEFLNNKLSDQIVDSYETKKFITLLHDSLQTIKKGLSTKNSAPIRVTGDTIELNKQLKEIDLRLEQLSLIRNKYQSQAEKYIVAGEVKSKYDQLINKPKPEGGDEKQLKTLDDEKSQLIKDSRDIEQVKHVMQTELDKSIQRNYDLLVSLPAYKDHKTKFNSDLMMLQLQSPHELFPVDNVGSKSNYMMMHLCFFLGLHEHMISVGQEHVPQFLFVDQPSIPYYAGDEAKGNDDKTKLIDAFTLLNSFITYITKDKKQNFQIFMVEHAPKEYWIDANLTQFHTVDEFIDGKGLIPEFNK